MYGVPPAITARSYVVSNLKTVLLQRVTVISNHEKTLTFRFNYLRYEETRHVVSMQKPRL